MVRSSRRLAEVVCIGGADVVLAYYATSNKQFTVVSTCFLSKTSRSRSI
jgi:hypothetical protein